VNKKIIIITGVIFCIFFIISQIVFISFILYNIDKSKNIEPKYEIYAEDDIYVNNNVEIAVPTEDMALAIGTIILKKNFPELSKENTFFVIDQINFWGVYYSSGGRDDGYHVDIRKKDGKIIGLF